MENQFWHWFLSSWPYLGVTTSLVSGYLNRHWIKDPDRGYFSFVTMSAMSGLFYPLIWLFGILGLFHWRNLSPREKNLYWFEREIKLKEWEKERLNKVGQQKLAVEEREFELTKRWVELAKDDPKQVQVVLKTFKVADETLRLLDVDLDSESSFDADASDRTSTSQKPSSS